MRKPWHRPCFSKFEILSVMTRFLAPLLVAAPFPSAESVDGRFAHVRGNRMAKAALETACWDLEARAQSAALAAPGPA